MKHTLLILSVLSLSFLSYADSASAFSKKIQSIVEALQVGNFETEKQYLDMLNTSCQRNQCNSVEKKKILEAGRFITACQTQVMKKNNIKNSDAKNICGHKQPIFGCDSNASPLLRKMCYSANGFSLTTWAKKERIFRKGRLPASK